MSGMTRKIVLAVLLAWLVGGCAGERPQNLGVHDGNLTACPSSPNCVSSQAYDARQRIAPFAFAGDPEQAFAHLLEVIKQRPDATIVVETDNYLWVELRTTLFVDDAEFLLDRQQHIIQVRSASRLGYSDLGKNRQRLEEIRTRFKARSPPH